VGSDQRTLRTRARGRVDRQLRDLSLLRRYPMVRLHGRVADLTMVPKAQFVDNLVVARLARAVPGDLVECGTWRGGMSAALAWALPGRRSVLLDSFEGLPDAKEVDGPAAVHWSTVVREHDNCTAEEQWAHDAMARVGQNDYELVRGWFDDTVPAYAARRQPIAVLRLDGDWYDSTMVCLEHLLPLVQPGGVVIVDDYFDWDGCSRAVHDHLSRSGSAERLRTSGANEFAYIIKGAGPT
jgi:O-methyltransferase